MLETETVLETLLRTLAQEAGWTTAVWSTVYTGTGLAKLHGAMGFGQE